MSLSAYGTLLQQLHHTAMSRPRHRLLVHLQDQVPLQQTACPLGARVQDLRQRQEENQDLLYPCIIENQNLLYPCIIENQDLLYPCIIENQDLLYPCIIENQDLLYPCIIENQDLLYPYIIENQRLTIQLCHREPETTYTPIS